MIFQIFKAIIESNSSIYCFLSCVYKTNISNCYLKVENNISPWLTLKQYRLNPHSWCRFVKHQCFSCQSYMKTFRCIFMNEVPYKIRKVIFYDAKKQELFNFYIILVIQDQSGSRFLDSLYFKFSRFGKHQCFSFRSSKKTICCI